MFAFNSNYNNYIFGIFQNGLYDTVPITSGIALVQNISETTSNTLQVGWEVADNSGCGYSPNCANPANAFNLLLFHNTVMGGRIHYKYNYQQTNTGQIFFPLSSTVGNLFDNNNVNGDSSAPGQAANTGWFPVDYSVGDRGNLKRSNQNNGSFPSWCGVFSGLTGPTGGCTGANTALLVPFVSDASYNEGNGGSNAGNGNYRIYSSAQAVNLMGLGGTCVLPYDLDGAIRNCSGLAAGGVL